ncbi:MAG: hypothetical protein QGI86_03275 [Candidatus Poribacteria bacterium]|jgi:hypothetical protein|nr:hypothetical protein [Candidatus Poribacteria bacterium]MDP6745564.1 hypothetical protein [Candidatus Poribacteria bacterium]MDP6995485.1 hypothetical protein [Candidatus Poribacteria bacterium]
MKTNTRWLILGLMFSSFALAQTYYPDKVGNEWFFLSTDGIEERVLRIEGTDEDQVRQLVDQTKEVNPPNEETAYSRFVIRPEFDNVQILKAVFTFGLAGEIELPYDPPQVFLPIPIELGTRWTVKGEVTLPLLGEIMAENTQEVVAVDKISIPAGTFDNCLQVKQTNVLASPVLRLERPGTMWLAPNLGPVKFVNSDDIVFELVRYNVSVDETAVSSKMKLATTWATIRNR